MIAGIMYKHHYNGVHVHDSQITLEQFSWVEQPTVLKALHLKTYDHTIYVHTVMT